MDVSEIKLSIDVKDPMSKENSNSFVSSVKNLGVEIAWVPAQTSSCLSPKIGDQL